MNELETRLRRAAPDVPQDERTRERARRAVMERTSLRSDGATVAAADRRERRPRRFGLVIAVAATVAVLGLAVAAVALRRPSQTPVRQPVATLPAPVVTTPGPDYSKVPAPGLSGRAEPSTRWHLLETRTLGSNDRLYGAAGATFTVETWLFGCTRRRVVVASSDPAAVGWEYGAMARRGGGDGYVFDPTRNVIYVSGEWATCGLGLSSWAKLYDSSGGIRYLEAHGERLGVGTPAVAALVDPRQAHPTATVVPTARARMGAILNRGLHIRQYALEPWYPPPSPPPS